jgi:hypothetical protein
MKAKPEMTERERTATLAVAYLPVADLVPYVSNARTHSDDQVAQIAASIKEFGFTNPILIDGDKGIIAGHGRLQAARKLGLDTVPTIELSGLSDAQRRAYILADNKLALNAGWDNELLALELADLADLDFDLSLIGFDDDETAALLDGGGHEAGPAADPGGIDYKEAFAVLVECRDEGHQKEVFDSLVAGGFACKVLVN